jgi:hypothetical protein
MVKKGFLMDIDEREMERENHAKDILHEKQMRDEEYFMEWTIENFHFSKAISLCDAVDVLTKHCFEYDQDVKVLFKLMGEV